MGVFTIIVNMGARLVTPLHRHTELILPVASLSLWSGGLCLSYSTIPNAYAQMFGRAEAAQYETTPDELGRLQARQRKLEQQWVRLLDAFQEDLLDKAQLGQRKQLLDQERQALGARIEHIQRQQVQQSAKAQIIDDFAAFCTQAQIALQNPTPEVKQEVLRLLVQSILFEEDAITIKHIIPSDDKCRLLPRGNMQKRPTLNDLLSIPLPFRCLLVSLRLTC